MSRQSSNDGKNEHSKCGQLRDYIDKVNRKQRERGKPDKYSDPTFIHSFGDVWVVFVNHYEEGRIGPRKGTGLEGKNAAAGELLAMLQQRDNKILGFININTKTKPKL